MSCSSLACGSISRFTNSSTSFASFRCSGVKKGSVSIIILRQLLIWPLAFGLRSLAFGLDLKQVSNLGKTDEQDRRPKTKDRRPKAIIEISVSDSQQTLRRLRDNPGAAYK